MQRQRGVEADADGPKDKVGFNDGASGKILVADGVSSCCRSARLEGKRRCAVAERPERPPGFPHRDLFVCLASPLLLPPLCLAADRADSFSSSLHTAFLTVRAAVGLPRLFSSLLFLSLSFLSSPLPFPLLASAESSRVEYV